MDWFARDFIKASLVWLGLGVTLGVCMAVEPSLTIYTPAHMHMNLLGFVTMMIYGVAYHVVPRFTGHPLWSRKLPAWHWFASNVGLALIVSGFALRVHPGAMVTAGTIVIATGGAASAFGAYAFILNVWKTIDGRTVLMPVASRGNSIPRLSS
jgi:heme/copper-type cytochrome/quinol oxidase subunit 1